jgi:hypothetical protein
MLSTSTQLLSNYALERSVKAGAWARPLRIQGSTISQT